MFADQSRGWRLPEIVARPKKRRFQLALPRWADSVFLLAGLGLCAWVVSRYPLADLIGACLRLGPFVAVTPLIALGWMACNTSALYLLLDRRVPWLELLSIRLTGDGYNALLPLAGFGGEPFKIKRLTRTVPTDVVLTALIRDRVLENGVGMLFTGTWLLLALVSFSFSSAFRAGVVGYVVVAGVVGAASLVLMVTTLPSRASSALARWLGVSAQGAVILPPRQFLGVLLWYLGGRFVGLGEATVLLHLLGIDFSPLTIGFCYSLLGAAGYLSFLIPGGFGVFEGTTVYMFGILGFPGPTGVAFALARRARMILIGLLGVGLHLGGNLLARLEKVPEGHGG